MKVIILSKWFPKPYVPNSGVFVVEQIKALRSLGVDIVQVIAPTPWAPRLLRLLPRFRKYRGMPRRGITDGFRVEHPRILNFPSDRFFFLYGLFFYLRCRRLVRKLLREQGADLIHAHTIMPEGFAAALLGREFGLPVVCTTHGGDINDLLPPFRTRSKGHLALASAKWALRNLRHLIAVSRDLSVKANNLRGDRAMEVMVAHNGADANIFRSRNKSETRRLLDLPVEKRIFVFVGNLVPEKGLPFLLEAFARIRQSDIALYLVGGGANEEELRAQSHTLGIESACIFAGLRQHTEIPLWLSAADCFVLSSITEGSPTILSEAMLCRTPIVATAVGGIPELVHDGETGLVVPSKDSAALARAMQFVLTHKDAAERMAAQAEAYAKQYLTWDANARKTLDMYRSALKQTRASEAPVEVGCLERSA